MKKFFYYLSLLAFLFVGINSCKKSDDRPIHYGYEYFGLETGRFVEYKVQYIVHDSLLNKHDTTNFFLKTVVGDQYIDNQGRTEYEFIRYKKDSLNGTYQFLHKWVAYLDSKHAELVEENQRKVKLVFPIQKNQIWDVNMYNMDGEQETHYSTIDSSYQNPYFSTDSAVTVEFYRYKTLIDDRLEQETYAPYIGMISKVSKELYFQFGVATPYKGTEMYYSIYSYGKN